MTELKGGDQSRDETLFESHYESCHVDIVPSSQTRHAKSKLETITRFLVKSKLETITFQ